MSTQSKKTSIWKDGRFLRLLIISIVGGGLLIYMAQMTGVLNPTKIANYIAPTPRAIPPLEPITIDGQSTFLPVGDIVNKRLEAGDWQNWSFYANAGEIIDIVVNPKSNDASSLDINLELTLPDGQSLAKIDQNGINAPESIQGFRLPITGEYSIWVADKTFTNEGNYTIHLMSDIYKNGYPLRFGLGKSIRGNTAEGKSHFYVFSGGEGQTLSVTLIPTGTGDPEFAPFFDVLAPDGTLLGSGIPDRTQQPLTARDMVLPETGNYTVWIGETGFDDDGEYILSAHAAGSKRTGKIE